MKKSAIAVHQLKEKKLLNPSFGVRTDFSEGSLMGFHKHEFFEVLYLLSEGCTHQFEGQEKPVAPGTLIFVPPYFVHQVKIPKKAQAFVLYFDPHFPKPLELSEAADIDLISIKKHPEFAPFIFQKSLNFTVSGADRKTITELFELMTRESRQERLGSLEMQRSLLRVFLLTVVRLFEAPIEKLIRENKQEQSTSEAIMKIFKFMQAHLSDKIALEYVAKEVFLTPNYVSHLIKRETGKTFSSLIAEKRIERAKELLQFTPKRLVEIAEEVGFPDEAYFSKRFKLATGKTPKKFRDSR
jgi:AraC-like DNA-binding protein/quercetin dioxygenase-like cupin family protein